MPLMQEAADFKSDVSTNFTIRAGMGNEDNPKQNSPDNKGWRGLKKMEARPGVEPG